jgi:hypothetical protein
MARKPRLNALTPPDAGEVDDGWANLLKEIDAQTPPLIDMRIVAKLRDMVTARIPQQFEFAKIVLGEEEARRQWKAAPAAALGKKKEGRPKGPKDPEYDRFLLELYDKIAEEIPSQIQHLPRFIGNFAHFQNKHVTPGAIAKRVRRRLEDRSKLPTGRGLINRTPR